MKQHRILNLVWAALMLLPLSCTQKEDEPYAPLPADILGMWMPSSDVSFSGTDRYVEFSDGQCYSYVSHDTHHVQNGYIVSSTAPFTLVNTRYCYLAANGNLIIGNKDMGKLSFINEFLGTWDVQKIMVIGSERYIPLKGFTHTNISEPRFSAIEIVHYGTENPIEKIYQMGKNDRTPLAIRLKKIIQVKGDDGIITDKEVEETDPKVIEENTEWVFEDWKVASVNSKNVLIGFGYGKARIKARTKDLACTDYFDVEVLGGGDLSAIGTANCYVVPAPGHYYFTPTQGNETTALNNIKSAHIIWETYMTGEKPAEDLITNLQYKDGKIEFDVPAKFRSGNVLISGHAGTGSESEILWSWHLWLCEDYDPDLNAQSTHNFGGALMDRYLGALGTEPSNDDMTSAGLLYQWGRKDPFYGARKNTKTESESAQDLLVKYKAVKSSIIVRPTDSWYMDGKDPIAYTILYPYFFLAKGAYTSITVWMGDAHKKELLWSTRKTKYDPCPPGWRVMTGGKEGTFAKALGLNPDPDSFPRTSKGVGFQLGGLLGAADPIYFPWTSCVRWDSLDGKYKAHIDDNDRDILPLNRDFRSAVWTAYPADYTIQDEECNYGPMVGFYFGQDLPDRIVPNETVNTYRNKSNAYPVRCIKEK